MNCEHLFYEAEPGRHQCVLCNVWATPGMVEGLRSGVYPLDINPPSCPVCTAALFGTEWESAPYMCLCCGWKGEI